MVARKQGAEARAAERFGDLLREWRLLLGRGLKATNRGVHRARVDLAPVAFLVVGPLCLLIGALGRIALAPESTQLAALATAVAALLLAALRFVIVRLSVRDLAENTHAVAEATNLGLCVWVVAVTPALTAVAWAASAALTLFGLQRSGERAASARKAVAYAWGAHLAATVIVWLVRNATVAWIASN